MSITEKFREQIAAVVRRARLRHDEADAYQEDAERTERKIAAVWRAATIRNLAAWREQHITPVYHSACPVCLGTGDMLVVARREA